MKKWFGVSHGLAHFMAHAVPSGHFGVSNYEAFGRVVALFDFMASRPEWSSGGIPTGAEFAHAVGLSGKKAAKFEEAFRFFFEDETGQCTAFVNANRALNNRRKLQAAKQRERRAKEG